MYEQQGYWQRRRFTRRRFLGSGALTAGGLALGIACSRKDSGGGGTGGTSARPTEDPANATRGGTLKLIWNVADAQLDPHTTTEHFAPELWRACSHGLLKQEAITQQPVPDLAVAWEQPDDLTYVFRLDERAKWQNVDPVNGRPVTADDVVYSLERISTPDPSHPRASGFAPVDSITATGDHEVTIKLKQPHVPILTPLSDKWTVIVPREVVEKFGDSKRGDTIIGCGPFICEQAESSAGATLVRNPDYWQEGLPYLDKVVYTTILDAEAQQAAFRSGQADVSPILPELLLDTFRAEDVEIVDFPLVWMNISVIGGPNDRAPLNDERVRRAINLAIDRDALAQAAFPGTEYQTAGVLESEVWGVPPEEVQGMPGFGKKTDEEIQEARQLIQTAGVEGTEILLNTTKAYAQYHIDRAEAIVPMLERIGFRVKLNVLEYAAFKDFESKRDFQLTAATYAAYGDPDTPLYNSFHSQGTRNYWNWSDRTYDEMVEKQRRESDPDKRKELILEIQRYLMKGTPVAHAQWYRRSYIGVRRRVHNFKGTNGAGSSTAGWFLPEVWVAQ